MSSPTEIESGKIHFEPDLKGMKVSIQGLSDTIVLSSVGEPFQTLAFHSRLAFTVIKLGIKSRIPLRGAICYGDFHLDSKNETTIMIGPAIDEVASWYEAADWVGAIYTPSAHYHWLADRLKVPGLVVEYDVPLSTGKKYVTDCVNWPEFWTDGEEELIKAISETVSVVTPDIATKYQNTIKFYQKMKKEG